MIVYQKVVSILKIYLNNVESDSYGKIIKYNIRIYTIYF